MRIDLDAGGVSLLQTSATIGLTTYLKSTNKNTNKFQMDGGKYWFVGAPIIIERNR